jgi:hypothetical protein
MFKEELVEKVISVLDQFFELESGNKITPFNMSGLKNNILVLFEQNREELTSSEKE